MFRPTWARSQWHKECQLSLLSLVIAARNCPKCIYCTCFKEVWWLIFWKYILFFEIPLSSKYIKISYHGIGSFAGLYVHMALTISTSKAKTEKTPIPFVGFGWGQGKVARMPDVVCVSGYHHAPFPWESFFLGEPRYNWYIGKWWAKIFGSFTKKTCS